MTISKADIDRLGNLIRDEKKNISDTTLNSLQEYRTSHKDLLSVTFSMLCQNTRKIHLSAIVTYRIKRFESIIGKLNRYPEMRFSRMWDIGGCRCILRTNNDVYKLKDLISKESDFEITKEYDYIKVPQKDGYKSLHLFIKHKSFDKVIEIQIRNQVDHNWATLVEITDVLYDSKLKELGNNKDLFRFHLLLSRISELNIEDKKEISIIIKQYNYFEKLSEVFSRNYIKVRRQWFDIESKSNHKFFLIETSKDDVPKIESFKTATEAELHYFNVYKSRQNANIVLTHLQKPNYNQISIAYSNYILTFHSFLTECYEILESLIVESLEQKQYYEYFKIYNLYNSLVFNHIRNLMTEIKEIHKYTEENKNRKNRDKKKEKEWIDDIQKQVSISNERSIKLSTKFRQSMPTSLFGKMTVKYITRHIGKNYQRKIKKVLAITAS
jgi:ppGpp synthetase/RelA/SpoT-type nucleotidyltranferase